MDRIQRIELFGVEIPLPEAIYPAWYRGFRQTKHSMILVRLTTESGIQGVSSGWSLGREREGLKHWLPNAFLGLDPLDIEMVRQRISSMARWGWNNYWLEPAFWDIRGQIEQKPVYQILMSNPETVEKVRVYASTIEYQKLDQRLRSVEQILNSGFSAISLNLGGNFDEDIHLIQHVRQLIGDRYLLLDACQGNMAWLGDSKPQRWRLHQALDFAAMIEEFQVEWLEDPIDMYAYDDISVLRSESTVPIAGGRLNAGWHEFKILIDRNSLDIYRPEATISGGIKTAMQVMDACVRRDYHFSPHCGGNSISLLINLHVFAACPRKFLYEFPCEPDRWTPQIRDALLVQPLNIDENGMLDVPQEPGFGIQLDEYALKQHATLWLDAER